MLKLRVLLRGAKYKELVLNEEREFFIGRSSSCDLQLEDQSGISRQHLRIFAENGQWFVQVLSKFGYVFADGEEVTNLELKENTIFKIPPYDFIVDQVEEIAPEAEAIVESPKLEEPISFEPQSNDEGQTEDFAEKTLVGRIEAQPYVRLVHSSDRSEKSVKLSGTEWIAGRDDSNPIFLNSSKASRRQFQIRRSGANFFIKDLGSSNGTTLNGSRLGRDEERSLQSGDVISVHGIMVYFEVRDANFERRITEIPEEILNPPAILGVPQYPTVPSQGGVIRLEKNKKSLASPRKKQVVMGFAAAAVLLLGYILSGNDSPKTVSQAAKPAPEQNQAFAKLTPAQKQLVKDSYNLAKTLQLQGKYALATEQIKKIHDLMPEGFLDSLKIAEESKEAEKYQRQVEELQAEQTRMAQIREKVKEVLFRCEKVANLTTSESDIRGCLAEAIELDPENIQISVLVGKVTQRAEEMRMRDEERKNYAARVQRARALYQTARTQESKRDWLAAIEAYNKFIRSGLPDPDGLKSRAERSIASIRQNMSNDIQKSISSADLLFKAGNHKEALNEVSKARKIDPDNEQARSLESSIARELNAQLQELYSNSVLDEGLGQVEAAKEKWRKILEIDRRDGDYYKRARSKLRTYGAN